MSTQLGNKGRTIIEHDDEEVSASNPLPVSVTLEVGDIEIGAVELKDATSDTRAVVNSDGSVNTKIISVVYATRIDEASATVTYIGKATTGSLTSAEVWQVQKIDTSSGTVITWADGNGNFDNEWDNRASLSYS